MAIRDKLYLKLLDRRDLKYNNKYIASVIDVELRGNPSMPLIIKYNVKIKDAIDAYNDIKKYAIKRLKKLNEFKLKKLK